MRLLAGLIDMVMMPRRWHLDDRLRGLADPIPKTRLNHKLALLKFDMPRQGQNGSLGLIPPGEIRFAKFQRQLFQILFFPHGVATIG